MASRDNRLPEPPLASGRGSTAYPPSNGKLRYGPGEDYRSSFSQPYRGPEEPRLRREPPRRRPPWYSRKRVMFPLAFLLGLVVVPLGIWFSTPHGQEMLRVTQRIVTPNRITLQQAFMGDSQVRVLLLGVDNVREGRSETSHRSDSILLASTDFDTKQIRVLSLPRDSWIPHYLQGRCIREADKLGHTFIEGGVECTKETVERLLDVPIEYYVTINFEGFQQVIDALGGIEINVEKRMRYTDNWGNLHIKLDPGLQRLNGEQAMGYARFRSDMLGDIARMSRQQEVLRAILTEMKKPENRLRLPALFRIFRENVDTNMSMDQLLALAQNMDKFEGEGMQTMTIENYGPFDGAAYLWGRDSHQGRNMAQYLPPTGIAAAREFLLDLEPPPPPEPELDEQDQGWTDGDPPQDGGE